MSAATVSAARNAKTASQWVVTPAVIDYILEQCRSFIRSECSSWWHRKLDEARTPEALHDLISTMVADGVFEAKPGVDGDVDTTQAVRENELRILTELVENCRRVA